MRRFTIWLATEIHRIERRDFYQMNFIKKHRKKISLLAMHMVIVAMLTYLFAAYTTLPGLIEARTLYIETALQTMSHKWLADIFPKEVVEEVQQKAEEQLENNKVEQSEPVTKAQLPEIITVTPEDLPQNFTEVELEQTIALFDMFPELDHDTVPEDLLHTDITDLQLVNTEQLAGIKTRQGDSVYAIDVPNKLLILNISGNGYAGKLAIVKDASRVKLGVNERSGRGSTVTEFCNDTGAVLGINASGFDDPGGHGAGNIPVGLVISDGEVHNDIIGGTHQMAGFDNENHFYVGTALDTSTLRDAMEFFPNIVLNGENSTDGSAGMGIQPRTALGQASNGDVLMLVIDGRQAHSLGTTVSECANILLRYNCWTALNVDGGSSSSMTYMGEMITSTSSPQKGGRYLPDAWLVYAPSPEPEPEPEPEVRPEIPIVPHDFETEMPANDSNAEAIE